MKTIFILSMIFSLNVFAAQSGIFMVVVGKVSIQKANGEVVAAKINSVVNPGEAVITDADSKAKIVMSDRNIINVLPKTKFLFKKYSNEARDKTVDLKLENGRIRTDVEEKYDGKNSKFEIKTGVAIVGVRGTQLVVSHDAAKNATEVVTLTGEVSVQKPGTLSGALGFGKNGLVTLKTQERVLVSQDSKSADVEKMNVKEFEQLKRETAVTAETKAETGGVN